MTTIDKIEIEKFSKIAKDWWNPNGKFKSLHLFNPARIAFIKEKLISHFKLNLNSSKPLKELKILDQLLKLQIIKFLILINKILEKDK